MLLFMKSAPSQGQVNSPNAQLSPPALAPGLPCIPSAATEPRPWPPLPENGPRGREAAGHQPLPPCSPPTPHCWPVLCPDPLGEGPIAPSRASVWGGSPWCGAGLYELAGLVKSSTPVMVALQKKQSLLFIRCWLMQALGQRKKEHQPPPTQHRAGQGLAIILVEVRHGSYSLA